MKVRFYTPSFGVAEEFGAASLGFVGCEKDSIPDSVVAPFDLKGKIIFGTYEKCLNEIPEGDWKVGIVLIGNAGNENEFIHTLSEKLKIPLVGGSAAINQENNEARLLYGRDQVALFLIDDDRYNFEVCCENIHQHILSEHNILFSDSRWIDKIDGCEPCEWLKNKKAEYGIDADDFEHMTFSDENGINVHLSEVDGKIFSGRDLSEHMYLRYVPEDEVQGKIESFYDDENAIVFGCAGLKKIIKKKLKTKGVGLYMFGEVCTKEDISDFGNLMLSKLRIGELS